MKLIINPEYQKLVPPHSKEEYISLENDIVNNQGIQIPIIINPEGVILDGMTRFKICKHHLIPIKKSEMIIKKFKSKLLEKKFVILNLLARRHLNDFQKVELVIPLFQIEKELAKQNMKLHHSGLGQMAKPIISRDLVSKQVSVSPRTFERAKFIIESGDEKIMAKVRSGQESIAYAERHLRKKHFKSKPISLPKGKWNVIYVDVPWDYDLQLSGAPDYPTLKTEEVCVLKDKDGRSITDLFAKDCTVYFWATGPKLEEAFKVFKAWGLTYKTYMIWGKITKDWKVHRGTGYHVAGAAEILLIATKGQPGTPMPEDMPLGLILEPKTRKHSEKPVTFYKIIEKAQPNGKLLELFARKKFSPRWTTWGNEIVIE